LCGLDGVGLRSTDGAFLCRPQIKEVTKMTFHFHRKVSIGAVRTYFSNWVVRRAAARQAARRSDSGSPWRPCPGAYALLVDVHRQR